MGLISALGKNLAENRGALVEGKCGITKSGATLNSRYAGVFPFGEIDLSDDALKEKLSISDPSVTRTTLLAMHAFRDAVADAGLSPQLIADPQTALIGATTVGGICLMDQLYADGHDEKHSAYFDSYDCASVHLFIGEHYHMNGIVNTINTACSSSANAIMYGARLIKHGLAERAIVGGVDSLAKFTVNGFNALHILSDTHCAPFDQNRSGLNLGEGAAYLVLEKEEDCIGKKKYAELTGYGNSNDAFHPSSLSDEGDGPYLSMKAALDKASITPQQIDFINAHGTGTENNDEVESKAMIRLFNTPPAFASTKANTGHTLGASGAVEAVFSVLNIVNDEIYPAVHFNDPIESTHLVPVKAYGKKNIQHVMSNSFGFGGNCTSLIFSKID